LTLKQVSSTSKDRKEKRATIRETVGMAFSNALKVGQRKQPYYWFLFNEILIICDQKKEESDKPFIFLTRIMLSDIQSVADKDTLNFMLVLESEQWKIRANSLEEKNGWMVDIRTAAHHSKKKARAIRVQSTIFAV